MTLILCSSPALYQRYSSSKPVDEWTLSQAMAADTANGGLGQLEQHYQTFIVGSFFFALVVLLKTAHDVYRPSKILQTLLVQA